MRTKQGFSLVEMVVALAVLSIMLVALNQILVSTSQVTLSSFKHIEADTEARLTLDRISYDISKMVQRSDVDYDFPGTHDVNGNDQFYVFSESTGYFLDAGLYPGIPNTNTGTSTVDPRGEVSLVGYHINPATNKLERLSKGLAWNGVTGGTTSTPMPFLPGKINTTWTDLNQTPVTDPDFQSIGEGVFHLSLTYLVENSGAAAQTPTPTPTPAALSLTPNLEGIAPGTSGYFNPKDVIAVIVSIAVLDPNSQKLIPASTLNATLSQASLNLAAPTAAMPLPIETWESQVFNLGLPKEAAAQVRFYQRFCYLNHPAY